MSKIKNFLSLYRLYRVIHTRKYALQRAYEISFKLLPF